MGPAPHAGRPEGQADPGQGRPVRKRPAMPRDATETMRGGR
jgi:hypothetical protein